MDLNPDQLPLIQGDEFLPSISPWATLGGGALVVIFGAAVTLTSVLSYNIAVKVPATIRPAGELRIIQAATEGTVNSIEAKENQVVEKGQAIAYIDDSRLRTQQSQLQENIQQGQLQLGQVTAQIGNLDAQIAAESSLVSRTVIAAQAELENSLRTYRDQHIATQADMSEAGVALSLARMQQARLKQEKELRATLLAAKAGLKSARIQRDRLRQIVASGAISRNQFEEKQLAVVIAEARLEQAKATAQSQSEEKELAVAVAEARLQRAKIALNPSNAGVKVATERIDQEQAKGKATLAALNKERGALIQHRIELQTQLHDAQKELQQVETHLSQVVVRAPTEGILLQLQLRNPGQVVQPGEAVAYVAPMSAPLLAKARVAAQDIDKVKPGQKVQMQVSACPYPDYGTLKGFVTAVAPDALPAASNRTSTSTPQASYEVIIQPQTRFVGNGDQQCRLRSGMQGRADIISRKETILKFILRKAKLLTDL